MYDVVICDDEAILRRGLKSWVEKSGLPLKVSGMAANGVQALELIVSNRPEIALMDINMPGIAGLDVIEEVKKRGIETHFIIISGHDEFQYAKRACRLHVADYLLKPVCKEELWELLKELTDQLEKNKDTQKRQKEMPEYGQPAGNGQKILEYIEKHFTEQSLSLGELSDHFHLSESYLTRLIKRETGCAFSEVLTKHRIGHATALLKQYPDMKLVEVAERTGFASQHYFSRVFKEQMGMAPKEYREKEKRQL